MRIRWFVWVAIGAFFIAQVLFFPDKFVKRPSDHENAHLVRRQLGDIHQVPIVILIILGVAALIFIDHRRHRSENDN